MKKILATLSLVIAILSSLSANAYIGTWQQVDITKVPAKGVPVLHPKKYLAYALLAPWFRQLLFSLPADPGKAQIIELPLPDGSFREFKVWQTPMMPDELAAKYTGIKTFTAEALGNHTITAKLDFTEYGFHAMIFDGINTALIDPYSRDEQNYYIVHYMHDEYRSMAQRMTCFVNTAGLSELQSGEPMILEQTKLPAQAMRIMNGYQLRTYRLALSADSQYCVAATGHITPTIAQAFSCMTTTMNRVNGIYEREFSITMQFVAKEDTLIWTQSTGAINGNDPFNVPTSIDGNAYACLGKNQSVCDSRIGTANYDIGHIFTTGAGGYSNVGVVCKPNQKAESVTGSATPVGDGFDVDYVTHEMGHELGAYHSFNNNYDGYCGGNADYLDAYEPGSGTTIMAYAGICDPDDLQFHSDPYFAAVSLGEIYSFTVNGGGNSCAVKTNTSNLPVGLPSFSRSYSIPYLTPFELMAPPATDSVADTSITYCWEQWNRGDFGARLINTHLAGPIFRSYNPHTSIVRVFPKTDMVLSGTLSNAGTEGNEGEKAPDTARFLTIKLTVRDIYQGNGCFLFPDDSIHLNVINTGAGFTVTSPVATTNWIDSSIQSVKWNVVNTNAAPINCDSVNIYLSLDSGYTWPVFLGVFPNVGSASVRVPDYQVSNNARIKVKGAGNVFFNVNAGNFSIIQDTTTKHTTINFQVYPVPAVDQLFITTGVDDVFQIRIINVLGQVILKSQMIKEAAVSLNNWGKGIYFIQLFDSANGQKFVKKFIVE